MKINFLLTHARVSKRNAGRAVDWMEDHIRQGYEVFGVVLVNDSPTGRVTKTVDLLVVMKQAKSAGMTLDDFENPVVDKMKPFTQSIQTDGTAAFGGAITEELGKRKMNVNVIGWDLWENPPRKPTESPGYWISKSEGSI